MATVNYRLKGLKIYVRLRHKREHDYEIPTGFQVANKRQWSQSRQKLILSEDTKDLIDEINPKLVEFENYITTKFNKAQAKGDILNREWLELCLQQFFERTSGNTDIDKSIFFTDFVEWYIDVAKDELNPRTSQKRKATTIRDFNTTLRKLKHFEEIKKHKYRHIEIDRHFHTQFIKYCEEYHGNNLRTIGGEIANIRQFLRRADDEGYKISPDLKTGKLFSPTDKTHDIALTKEDVEKITNHDFSDNERLDNARDWFVIGIWTGLRVSDLLKLDNTKVNDGFFELENYKTGIFVVIPIHEDVQKILDKRNGFPRRISDQRFNEYIKEVAKEAGLTEPVAGAKKVKATVKGYGDEPSQSNLKKIGKFQKYELVSSHICRRTFATLHYGKLDTLTIMKITGHTTEKQFLEYVKISPREHAQKMKQLWNKTNKDEQR